METISKQLTVIQQSLEPAKQELQPSKNGDVALVQALNDLPVKKGTEESLKEVLRLIILKVGIRANNLPTEEEKAVLIAHIVANYGNHTAKEILLAFEMAIADKLELEHRDVVSYENFSCLYFSTIMNAYRDWAKVEVKHAVKEVSQIENKENLSDQAMIEWMGEQKELIKAGKLQVDFVSLMLYEYAVNNEILKPTVEEKKGYLVLAAKYTQAKLEEAEDLNGKRELSEFNEMLKTGEFTGKHVEGLKNLAKKMILFDHFLKSK